MYLHTPDGERCGFGWESEEWQHEEIYAMDPRNPEWVELIISFYCLKLVAFRGRITLLLLVIAIQYNVLTGQKNQCVDYKKQG